MAVAIPAAAGSLVVTCEYNDAAVGEVGVGLAWAILHDNPILGWIVDETGGTPATPIIIGTMLTSGPDTGDVKSPPWAIRDGTTIFIPDMARGTTNELFNFIAKNNGANRSIYANFADTSLVMEYRQWASANPALALSSPPNVAPVEDPPPPPPPEA